MEHFKLRCQLCHISFNKVFAFKSHVQSHGKRMKEIFPNDVVKTLAQLPFIVFMKGANDWTNVNGLSHLTLVIGDTPISSFYLCHVCHLKCPVDNIPSHVRSSDHFTNFLSITDPNSLEFSWMPQNEKNKPYLCGEHMRRNRELQILHLPAKLLSELTSSQYAGVMRTLSRNEKLFKRLQDALPETDLIQTYQKDSKRKSPLLGLHHIVECVCVGPSNERYFLCTLCHLPVAPHMIIKHVLSFDHVFRYIEEWHPSTLLSKASYIIDASFSSKILDLAKQAEELQGCTNMKHMRLEPDEFTSVNFKSYSEALTKLELIKKCSLQISVKPGEQLVCRPSSSEKQATPAVQSTPVASFSSIFKISCQVCHMHGHNMFWFLKHLAQPSHQTGLVKVFNDDAKVDGSQYQALFNLGLYSYVQNCLRKKEPLVGIPMIVSCISAEVTEDPFYLCFACSEHFSSSLVRHLTSEKHLMLTLSRYQDPEVLPFAWKSDVDLDVKVLKAKVWEKEKKDRSFIPLKVIDLPYWIFCDINTKGYTEAVEVLKRCDTRLTDGVPPFKTNYGLQAKNNLPVLGKQFLVKYEAQNSKSQRYRAFLCLLCQRKLRNKESHVHIFCQEHVVLFLEKFHPGSLDSSNVDAKCLLDLAQQAQTHQPGEKEPQEVNLTVPVRDSQTYKKTTDILKSAEKQDCRVMFEPKIQPKGRLVPSGSPSTANENHVRGHSVEKTPNVENKGTKNVSSEQKVSLEKEVLETNSAVETKSEEASLETTKEESKEAEVDKTSREVPGSSQSAVKEEVGAHCEHEAAKSSEIVPAQLEKCSNEGGMSKRSIGMCEGSPEDRSHKRQRFTSEGEAGLTDQSAPAMEESHKPSQNGRLSKLYDCRCDKRDSVYLCECCSLKIPQDEFISHVNGSGHPNVVLKVVQLEEDMYSVILKHSFESVIEMVSVLLSRSERPSTPPSAPPSVKEEEISITLHEQHIVDSVRDHIKVENVKTEGDSETCEAAASILAVTSNATQAAEPREYAESHVGIFESASTTEKNLAPPALPGKLSEADSTFNSDLDERMAVNTICTATSSPCTATTEEVMEVSSASSALSDAEAAQQNAEGASPKGSTGVHEGPSIMADNNPQYLETAPAASGTCQKLPKSVATGKKSILAVKKGNRVEGVVNVSAHIAQSAAPQVIAAMPGRPESKREPTKLPLATANKTKSTNGSVKIGTDQLIVFMSSKEKRQQVYCQLCSVRLLSSDHLREMSHQYNYVQMKIPGWTAKPLEYAQKFQETVAMLAKEQGSFSQRLEVMIDVYEEVNRLPVKIAIKRLTEMLMQKSLKGSSSSTANNVAALQKTVVIGSPCEVTSSDDGVNVENNRGCVKPQVGYPESTSTFFKTPATSKETPVSSQQQPRKVPELKDTQKTPGHAQKTSCVMLSRNPRVEPASDDKAVQSQSRPSNKEDQVVKQHARPGGKSSSEEPSRVSIGVNGDKNRGCVKPQVGYPESTSTFFKTPATSKETPVSSQQQPRKAPELKDAQKTPGHAQKTYVLLSRNPRVEPAAADKVVQSQSRPSNKEDQVVKHHARPGGKSSSEEPSRVSIGVHVEKNRGCVKPQVGYPESTSTFSKTPATSKETPVSSQQPRKVPELKDAQKPPGHAQKTSYVMLSRNPRVEPASDDKVVQSQSRPSNKEDQVAKHHGGKRSSEEPSRVSIAVDVENNRGCVKPQVSYTKSTSRTPATSKETPVGSQQQPRKVPELKDTQKTPGHAQKTYVVLSRNPPVEPASDYKAVQSQSRPSNKEDQVAKHHARPGGNGSSEEPSRVSIAVGVDVGNDRGCAKPQVSYPESTSTLSKTPATSQDAPVGSQPQPRKGPELQKKPRDGQKTSEVKLLGWDRHVEPAAYGDDKEVQSQSRPGRGSSSEEVSTISIGERIEGESHLLAYLSIKKMDAEPIIGQGTVWECRGISQMPFFLCESCELMLPQNNICQHMISQNHKFNYLQKRHTELLQFWTFQDLLEEERLELFDLVTSEVAKRESILNIGAKIVLLRTELYEYLQKAPFTEALKLLESISERKLRVACLPTQKSQQLESQQSLKLSLPTKMQLSPTPLKDQGRKHAVKKKHVNEDPMDGELHDVQKRKASSPLDARSFPSKADAAIAPLPQAGTCIQPRNMCASLSVQKEVVPPVSQHQTPTVHVLAANLTDEDSKSLSSAPGDLEVAQTLPLSNPPSRKRKRPADTSVETLVRSCTRNSPKNSLPTKSKAPPLQPIQEPSSVSPSSIAGDPAATPSSLPLQPEHTKSISDIQSIPPNYFTVLSQIISVLRDGTKACSATDIMKAIHCRAITSIPSDEGKASLASESIERNTTDKGLKISGGIPRNPLLNQLLARGASSTSAASKSLFQNNCMRDDPTLTTTESNGAGGVAMCPTTSTASHAESSDPRHPQGSTRQLTCSAVAPSVTEPGTSDACPINTIVLGRGNYACGYVVTGSSKGPTKLSSNPQVGLSTGLSVPTPAAYAKYSKATYGKPGHSFHKTTVNPTINPTFTSPTNMVVNPLANTVNSSVIPHVNSAVNYQASTITKTFMNSFNSSVQPHTNSAVNPPANSVVNPPTNSVVNYSINPHANSVVNPAVTLHVNPHAVGQPDVDFAANTVANPTINPPVSSQSSCQSSAGLYPSQIHSGVNYLHLQTIGHSSAVGMEPRWTNVEMQQYQYRQQYYQQQQHYQQQQYYQLQQHLQQQRQQQYSNQQQNQNQQHGWYQQSN